MKVFIPSKSKRNYKGELVTTGRYSEVLKTPEELQTIVSHLKQEYYTIKHNIEEAFKIDAYKYCKTYLKELKGIKIQLSRVGIINL